MSLASVTPGAADPADHNFRQLAKSDMNLLAPLLALLEERNVTDAANRVGLSQPAMSNAFKRMRTLLHDDLLVRRHGKYWLTPYARRILPPLRSSLSRVAEILAIPEFDPLSEARVITIAAATTMAFSVIPAFSKVLAAEAPKMTLAVQITTPDDHADFFADPRVDGTLLSDTLPAPYPRHRLYNEGWAVITSEGNPHVQSGLNVEHLVSLPHLAFDAAPYRIRPYIEMDARGLECHIRAEVRDPLLLAHLIQGSDCMAFVHSRVARRLADRLGLAVHPVPFPVAPVGVDIVWNQRMGNEAVQDWLTAALTKAVTSPN